MKLDPVLTADVQKWLNTPDKERDIRQGATLMLQLNRNRALFNSVMLRPDKFKDKLVYELNKFLRIRLDNMTVAQVASMEAEVLPRVGNTIDDFPVISVENELPAPAVAKGKRPDHDSLPPHIRDLWESNAALYRKIVLLFNELKAMNYAMPCDRYEKLRILDEADKLYRSNLRKYDEYVAKPAVAHAADDVATNNSDIVKAVGAARKTISKYKKIIAENPDNLEKINIAKDKIQSAVSVIRKAGAEFSDNTVAELSSLGIRFDP